MPNNILVAESVRDFVLEIAAVPVEQVTDEILKRKSL